MGTTWSVAAPDDLVPWNFESAAPNHSLSGHYARAIFSGALSAKINSAAYHFIFVSPVHTPTQCQVTQK